MSASGYEQLRSTAVSRATPQRTRLDAIKALADLETRDAVEVLLEIGGTQDEADAILSAAGRALARLLARGVMVTEWDLRDLTPAAAEAFFE